MLVAVNGIDITNDIDSNSYSMNAESTYESWLDGNYREHRIYTRTKIKGSFDVFIYGKNNIDTSDFLENWNNAVSNNIVTLLVYVQNLDRMEAIEAFFEIEGISHKKMWNGNYADKLTISVTER